MKTLLYSFSALLLFFGVLPSTAIAPDSGTYYSFSGKACAVSKWSTPRYNQSLPFRHFDDYRRYNAAPCYQDTVPPQPYLMKTVVVRKKREPYYYIDSRGHRRSTRILVTTYKELYSNGTHRVYTVRG